MNTQMSSLFRLDLLTEHELDRLRAATSEAVWPIHSLVSRAGNETGSGGGLLRILARPE